jgi:hypothetical protein
MENTHKSKNQENKSQNINETTLNNGSSGTPPYNNNSPKNDNPTLNENIPKMSTEEEMNRQQWWDSPKFNEGLQEILPKESNNLQNTSSQQYATSILGEQKQENTGPNTINIYTITGEFIASLKSENASEDYFIKKTTYQYILENESNQATNEKSKDAISRYILALRNSCEYYTGENTRNELANVVTDSNNEGKEHFYYWGVLGGSKEIHILDVSDKIPDREAAAIPINLIPSLNSLGALIKEKKIEAIHGWGHSHIWASAGGKNNSGARIEKLNSPSQPKSAENPVFPNQKNPRDFMPLVENPDTKKMGGNPSILATPHGYTVYQTLVKNHDKPTSDQYSRENPDYIRKVKMVQDYDEGNILHQQD